MDYENPKIEEGINYSREHPLKEFATLVIGLVALTALLIMLLHYAAGFLAPFIPFDYEKKMLNSLPPIFEQGELDASAKKKQRYLQGLADRLAAHIELPEGMTVSVSYLDDEMVNAFATLGGKVFFLKGLLDSVESEDELAMVMAHEIAHVQHRHPIVAMGKGLTIATLGSVISGVSGSSAGEWLIGSTTQLSMLKFSRDQETQSDETALAALVAEYGHAQGARELFDLFAEIEPSGVDVEILRSHPYSDKRWQVLKAHAQQQGWSVDGELTPLPSFMK